MSTSEQLNMGVWSAQTAAEAGEGGQRTNIDSELASIVSALSSAGAAQSAGAGNQQQIGGFRRASFNSNGGSDVDSEIFFTNQTSPMLRRTTLSVGGVSLPANSSSHAQNRLSAMNHYSASIAGGLTNQYQVNGSQAQAQAQAQGGPLANANANGAYMSGGGVPGASGATSGFFERFGRALAEGTREVELSVATGNSGNGSRRASATTGMEHLSRVASNSTLQVGRRRSETSEVLDSVSESLNMQHNEPNPTTIWNVAAAPVFRPHQSQNFPQQQQQQQENSSGANGNSSSSSNQDSEGNEPAAFTNQPAFNYGYPHMNQFGMPMFLPPVLSPPPQPYPSYASKENGGEAAGDGKNAASGNVAGESSQRDGEKMAAAGMAHPMASYPFPAPYPFVYQPINENPDGEEEAGDEGRPMSGSFIPPNPYMFMPPPPAHTVHMPDGSGSPSASGTYSANRNHEGKSKGNGNGNGKGKSNPYLHSNGNNKGNYVQFSPPPSRMQMQMPMPLPMPMSLPMQQMQQGQQNAPSKPARQAKNNRQNNKQPIVRSALLEEFRNNPTNKVYKLKDIYGSALEFCKDQHGSRFIQQELATSSDAEKEIIFNEIRDESISLSHDVFGNYVIQKFFEHGTKTQRNVLVDQFKGKMENLSLEMYACRVIQKAFEFLDEDQKVALVSELSDAVLPMIKDQNGNHVIQKAIECIPIEKLPFILKSLKGQIYHLSTHSYGCRVVQRLLEFGSLKDQDDILNDLDEFIPFLIQDQYGNYVIQHILQHGSEDLTKHISNSKQEIVNTICGNVVEYSKHKFASNVVEKSVLYGSKNQIRQILNEILPKDEEDAANLDENAPLILMMRDQYANYVVQKLVGVASGNDEKLIVIAIRSHLDRSNKNNSLGNRHLASVEKLATLVEKIQI